MDACLDFAGRADVITLYVIDNARGIPFNELTTMPPGYFDSMPQLNLLRIDGNQLTSLPSGFFDALTGLNVLRLDDNQLTTLPAGIFEPLTQLNRLQLEGNPLVCLPTVTAPADVVTIDEASNVPCVTCTPGDVLCDDPHMRGMRGQKIDWSGVDGGWYSLIKDNDANLDINVRLTAPLPEEFPDRQLVTGLSVLSDGHSLTIEVENPYTVDTGGCPEDVSPCLANGGLRIVVDGQEVNELLQFSRQVPVADGAILVSASNLPVECRQFGGDKIWARMYQEMMEGRRELLGGESLEDWILRFDHMAAPDWCAKYIAENDLADLQSTHAIFKIETPTVTVRLNAGVNYQGGGDVDWQGRALPDLEFWQMDVGMDGLDGENPSLSGILGETARPMYDESGKEVMEGFEAFRGTVEDYRVSGASGVHFALLDKTDKGRE
eukprot:g6673.t1